MRKTKEVLRLRFEGLGQRQIARSCGMGLGTVHDYLERAAAAGIRLAGAPICRQQNLAFRLCSRRNCHPREFRASQTEGLPGFECTVPFS
jgi:hypothetical protein